MCRRIIACGLGVRSESSGRLHVLSTLGGVGTRRRDRSCPRVLYTHESESKLTGSDDMDASNTGEQPFDQFSLSVQREEVESVKAGSAVYVRKSKLFFLSTKQEALDHIERASAQPAATPTAADLHERAA
jgi:hypothetical protein